MDKAKIGKWEWAALLVILLAAAFLRFYALDQVPPGWRDDELINSLVISQHALDGEWALFYPDASGHEGLYHGLNATMLALFGPGVAGIRWLSALMGVLSVLLTFLLGRELFGRWVGLLAALGLSTSFWSLMYSRIGLRHISLLPFMLGAFFFWWRMLRAKGEGRAAPGGKRAYYRDVVLCGLGLGLGFYTYFASRGVPFILLGVVIYWLLVDRALIRRHWRGVVIAMGVALLLAVPLAVALSRLPEMTDRVEELAVPLAEARNGNLDPLWRHVRITLSMFHADGDDEWLYNIPHRPVFGGVGALLLLAAIALNLYRALSLGRTGRNGASALLLFWLGAGLVPGFLSVPPASLGHTIIAQPAVYILVATALVELGEWAGKRWGRRAWAVVGLLALLFLSSNAVRDLKDYFVVWPERGMVRFLYRADIRETAAYLNAHPELEEVALGGSLAGPWDRQALLVDLSEPVADRWFDPSRALLFPASAGHLVLARFPELAPELAPILDRAAELEAELGAVQVHSVRQPELTENLLPGGQAVRFDNGLALTHVSLLSGAVLTGWHAETPPTGLPPFVLVSNPPPPGVETRPRLAVFAHLLDEGGAVEAGDDGLWVDPYTLRAGDRWLQLHRFPEVAGEKDLEIGLYDPVTGQRVALAEGGERFLLEDLGW